MAKARWPEFREQVLFDMRDERMVEASKQNIKLETFNKDQTLFGNAGARPQLKFAYNAKPCIFKSSIHLLKEFNQILHASAEKRLSDETIVNRKKW